MPSLDPFMTDVWPAGEMAIFKSSQSPAFTVVFENGKERLSV